MDALIISSLQGHASPSEEERLRRWRAESPANDRRYRHLEEVWSTSGRMDPLREHDDATPPDLWTLLRLRHAEREERFDALVMQPSTRHKVAGPVSHDAQPQPAPPDGAAGRWRRSVALGVLAASLAILGVGLASWADRTLPPTPLPGSEIVTGAGEMATVTLGDGSTIRIGPRSKIRFSHTDGDHVAWLEGRAFFGVPTDPSRTFRVRTEYGEATVLGTRFEVRAEEDEFRVLVLEGSVRVATVQGETEVREGEMSRSGRTRAPSTLSVADMGAHLDWIGRVLVFQGTPLRRALGEVERAYGMEVMLDDPALADLLVTATFTDQEIEEVLLTLCEILGVACTLDEGAARVGIERASPGLRVNG